MTGYLSDDLYRTVTGALPIVCVDAIPVRRAPSSGWQIGIIIRATGSETGRPALVGGRIRYGETIRAALVRHLKADLQIKEFGFIPSNDESRPFYVEQYAHHERFDDQQAFDPTKQSVALTYLVHLDDEPQPRNEASAFQWISQPPESAAFNQHGVMAEAFKFLAKTGNTD